MRSWAWGIIAFVALLIAFAYGQVTTTFFAAPTERSVLFFLLGLCGIGLVFCWPLFKRQSHEILVLCVLSFLIRMVLLPTAPSDDIYRYLWEGKLIRGGVSPYAQTADAAELESFRDDYWQWMNNLDKKTAYPPLAELTFAAVGWVGYSPFVLKLFFALMDCLVVGLLMRILQLKRMPIRWAGLYAFNPVPLIAFAGEGHFDVLLVAAMLTSLLCLLRNKAGWAWLFLGLAVQFKFMALLLVPFLFKYTRVRTMWPFFLAVLLPALPFVATLPELMHGLSDFAATRSFNGCVHGILLELMGSRTWANAGIVIAFLAILSWRFFRKNESGDFIDDAIWVLGALLILAPTVHFWYFTWVFVFFVFRPSLAWIVLGLSQAWYFGVWRDFEETGHWAISEIEQILLWGPFLIIGLYELRWLFTRRAWRHRWPTSVSEPTVSLVIPTFNASDLLGDCLTSVHQGTRQPAEIIIADGGSTDVTEQIARGKGAEFIQAPKGRGAQIRAGVLAAKSDVVLVLHADSRISRCGLESLIAFKRANMDVIGGSLGQRFEGASFSLLLIELLNEARATLKGASFGDQGQFFDRAFAASDDGFPAIPLMEDVEMGQRMLKHGRVAYLGNELLVSSSKWQHQGWWLRFTTVLRLVIRYRWARIFYPNQVEAISRELYDCYYS